MVVVWPATAGWLAQVVAQFGTTVSEGDAGVLCAALSGLSKALWDTYVYPASAADDEDGRARREDERARFDGVVAAVRGPNLLEGAIKGKDKGKGGGGSPRSSTDDANTSQENPKPKQDGVGELLDIAGGLLNKDKNKDKKKDDREMRDNPDSRDIGNQRISSDPKPAAATAPSTAPTTQRNVSGRTRGLREENNKP